jgi:hypothetical protein
VRSERERERFSREEEGSIASGFSYSPRFQTANDKRERFADLDSRRKCPAGLLPPLGRFAKERKREREKNMG